MRNVYGTYQNVNRFSEMISVKVFRTDPYIYIYLVALGNSYEFFFSVSLICGSQEPDSL